MTTTEVREMALRLSPKDRAMLARELIESLDGHEIDPDHEDAWIDEIEARAEALEREEAQSFDGPSSLEKIRREIREGQSR
jgi:putative addiction module component (TIGR02574 family)